MPRKGNKSPENEFRVSEIPAQTGRGRGRPKDPDSLRFHNMGLREKNWEYLRQWQIEGEGDNFTPALGRLIEFAQKFAPGGAEINKPRDPKTGRFLPQGGCSKTSIQKQQKRERSNQNADTGEADVDQA